MATAAPKPKIIAIVGPTASGKSGLAMRIAKGFNGEIIAADSLTIYRNMDIGTAKPNKDEQKQISHWGLDIIGPGRRFTVADFKNYAKDKIADIHQRGKLSIIVGGTGLYIDSILYDYDFGPVGERDQLNPRHRLKGSYVRNKNLRSDVIIVGLMPRDEELKQKISRRVEAMLKAGLSEEARNLLQQYGREGLLAKARVAYGPVIEYLSGSIGVAEAREQLKTLHWQYARRQRTWFKRNPHIHWFGSAEDAYQFIAHTLSN